MMKGMILLVTFMLLQLVVLNEGIRFSKSTVQSGLIHKSLKGNQTWPSCSLDLKIKASKKVFVGQKKTSSQQCGCDSGAIVRFGDGVIGIHNGILRCCKKCYTSKLGNCLSQGFPYHLCTSLAAHECICDCHEEVLSDPVGDSRSECLKLECKRSYRGCCVKNQCTLFSPKGKSPKQK